ncbi:MAG: SDR family oxidoreductase, partial [Acidobacteria bacterium]
MPPSPPADRFLVTGCASGIGCALAGELARRGHRLLATDRDLDALRRRAAAGAWPELRVRLARLDVRRPDDWRAALDRAWQTWGGLDVVVNVAGVLRLAWVQEASAEDVDLQLDVNLKGVVHGTRLAAARMIPQGHGQVINVASLAALAPIPGLALYSASKYAVRAFSLAAAEELRPHGVAVSVICPDAVATPMLDRQLPRPEAALTFTAPRILQAEEVARVIAGKVVRRRPLLVSLPRRRAALARLADLWPGGQRWL